MAAAFGAVLGTAGGGGSPATTLTVTTTATVPAGGRIYVAVGWYSTPSTVSVSGGSLTWANDGVFINTTTANYHSAVLSADCPAGLASTTVLTATFSIPSDALSISCFYATGVAAGASGYLDGAAVGGSGTATGWATASLATANADDFLVCAGWIDRTTTDTPGGSFTEIHDFQTAATGVTFTSMYRIVAAASSYTGSGTWAAAGVQWTMVLVAYQAAAAGGAASLLPRARAIRARSFIAGGARFAR